MLKLIYLLVSSSVSLFHLKRFNRLDSADAVSFSVPPGLCDQRNECKMKQTLQYSAKLAIFQKLPQSWAETCYETSSPQAFDVSRDVITTRIRPNLSSIHVRRTAKQLKGPIYQQAS